MKTKAHTFVPLLFGSWGIITILTVLPASGQHPVDFFGPELAGILTDGNSSLAAPFFTAQSARFQQVYSASAFSGLTEYGGGMIQNVIFRLDANITQDVFATLPSFQLFLSTTSLAPDGLSSTFANNVGADNTLVVGPTSVILSSASGGGSTSYDLAFSFPDNKFFYNPANGNLLIDLQIITGAGGVPGFGPRLDAFNTLGDAVSSVLAYGNTVPSSGQTSTIGLATEFSIFAAPEPSTWALIGTGLIGLAICRCKKTMFRVKR